MKLVVIGGGNMGLTYAKGIHQAGLLTEKISIFNEKNLLISDLFNGQGHTVIMVAARIGNIRLIDNIFIN